ncbi:MAG: cyclic nucleotide-binding domain-containing protein [Clostridiales bacterium]|nr:cyclic nucleotide-binding domain-containing protein [Clostridiales bacterium]
MSIVEKTFKNGEVIINEGDTGNSVFLLMDGKAGVYSDYGKKDHFKLAVLEEGEYFGEMAILEEYPRSATVAAMGGAHVVEIPGNELDSYFKEYPDQILELMKHLGNRVRVMNNDYNEAKALLKKLQEEDESKKKSLFSKIKKHIDLYQHNKNSLTEPREEILREAFSKIRDDGSDNIKSFRKGMFVFREGKDDDSMYILLNGTVGFYNSYRTPAETKTDEITAVSIFGEEEMLAGDPRSCTAVVETDDTRVEIIRKDDLEPMFSNNPDKLNIILRNLSYRLRMLNIDFLKVCKEITETYNK